MRVSTGICFAAARLAVFFLGAPGRVLLISAIVAAVATAFVAVRPAHAVDMTDARVFVAPWGSDATCSPQPISAGPNPNLINPPYTACKTIQHACDIAVGIPKVHVAPAVGNYIENFVCNISGTDAAHPVAWHIAEQVKDPATGMTGPVRIRAAVSGRPIAEFTGSFINVGCAFCHFEGFDPTKPVPPNLATNSDGIYVHGTADHHAVNQKTYYGTDVSRNTGYGIHVRWSDTGLITSDTIANNVKGGVLVEDSTDMDMYSNAIYRSGAVAGIPAVKTPAVIVKNTPYGEFTNNKALYAVSVGLILDHSQFWIVDGNHVTAAGWPPFSYQVIPASDEATDTIGVN